LEEHRPPGRPPLSPGHASTDVCVKMPVGMYDQAYALATRERVSVPEVMRRALGQILTQDRAKTAK